MSPIPAMPAQSPTHTHPPDSTPQSTKRRNLATSIASSPYYADAASSLPPSILPTSPVAELMSGKLALESDSRHGEMDAFSPDSVRSPLARVKVPGLKFPVFGSVESVTALMEDETSKVNAVANAAKTNVFYRPHSITALVFFFSYLIYGAFGAHAQGAGHDGLSKGLSMAALTFVFIGSLMFRNGPFIRPHPVFWRAVLAISVLYLLIITFLLFLPLSTAQGLVALLDPALGRPLPEKSYNCNCALTVENVRDGLDFFIFAHVFGWWAKTIILRDWWLCWILSVSFEFCEYSLQHQLPNFQECWWDHWILDVAVCNWLGIWMGLKTVKWLQMKSYSWRDISEIPSVSGKMFRSVSQFTPHHWITFDWAATKTFKGYCFVTLICALLLTSEVAGFYLKYLLWIPPPHPLFSLRSTLYAFAGCAGVREMYQYCTDPQCQSLGDQTWILLATIIMEVLVIVKWSQGKFPEPHPPAVLAFWALTAAFIILFPLWQFFLRPRLFAQRKSAP